MCRRKGWEDPRLLRSPRVQAQQSVICICKVLQPAAFRARSSPHLPIEHHGNDPAHFCWLPSCPRMLFAELQAEDRVLNFLKQHNRPYNVQVIIPWPSPSSDPAQNGFKLSLLCAAECV